MGQCEFPQRSLSFTFDGTLTVSPQLSFFLESVLALEISSFRRSLLVF